MFSHREEIEFVQPPKEMRSLILEILAQNRLVLDMNEKLLRVFASPPLVVKSSPSASNPAAKPSRE